jgi:hypothetical protein
MAKPEALPLENDDQAEHAALEHMMREWAAVARAVILRRRQQ